MKSEKTSKIRKRVYSVNVVKKNTTRASMQKDAPNPNGDVRELASNEKSRMHNEGKYVKL